MDELDKSIATRLRRIEDDLYEARPIRFLGAPAREVLGVYRRTGAGGRIALTGRGRVVRRFPMVPGVDLAGTVVRSSSDAFAEGDRVLATGCGLGERHFGGFAERARLPGEWLVAVPETLTITGAASPDSAAAVSFDSARSSPRPGNPSAFTSNSRGGIRRIRGFGLPALASSVTVPPTR